jgi:hypothetical protein
MHTPNETAAPVQTKPNYIVFAGVEKRGGWSDLYETAATLIAAKELCKRAIQEDATWTQIVCVNTMTVVQTQSIVDYTQPFVSVCHEDEYYN